MQNMDRGQANFVAERYGTRARWSWRLPNANRNIIKKTGSSWISVEIFSPDHAFGCFQLTVGEVSQPRLLRQECRSHIQIR